jgi:carotenoid cleavage dioxygenase
VLDINAMLSGGSMLSWRPELGTRIAVVPRTGDGPARTAELGPLWVWHFANAYEDGGRVIADFPSWSELSFGAGSRRAAANPGTSVSGRFTRVSVDPARGTATLTEVAARATEFPRIDDRLTGRRHRYLTTGAVSGEHQLTRGEHDQLIRWDMSSGRHQTWDTDASIGEVIFVPRQRSSDELDGYYMTLARGLADDRSWLYIWDAGDFPGPPRAKVEIPAVVPNGLHANWFPLQAPT